MIQPTPMRSRIIVASYAGLAVALGFLLRLMPGAAALLIILVGPVVVAALFYSRTIYLLMAALGTLVSIWALSSIALDLYTALKTLGVLVPTMIVMAEIAHWLTRARARAESALRESEERYRQMFENNQAIKLVVDVATGAIVDANAAACAFYGYSWDQLSAKNIAEINMLDRAHVAAAIEQAASGQGSALIFRHRLASGAVRDVEVHSGPVVIAGRQLLYSIVHDITERVQAERRGKVFLALGQKLSAATTPEEAARIIVAIADELLGWDACVLDLYTADGDSYETLLIIDTLNGQRVTVPPALVNHTMTPIAQKTIAEGPQLLLRDVQPSNDVRLVPFGDVDRPSASLMFVPIRSGADVIGILSIQSYTPMAYNQEDLNTLQALAHHCGGALERTRAAAKQRESEARYRAISELASDYIFSLKIAPDGKRIYEWVTDAFTRITGYTIEEFDARGGWLAMVHPDDLPIADRRAQVVLSGRPDVSELRIITKQGETRWLRSYTQPVWDSRQERVVRVFGAMQDITERKRAEESLLHRQKLESLGVLAGGIAHDFNNLLAAILGNADLALLDLPTGHPVAEAITQVQLAGRRAADLTRQMLAYAGKGRFVVEQIDLNALIAELSSLLNTSIGKNVALRFDATPRLPAIEADVTQISQVVLNLIVNAAEAIGESEGTITVTTGVVLAEREDLAEWGRDGDLSPGEYVVLSVADTGCGMDEATRTKIFDPFFSTKFTGRGLGLAAVLGIVRSHKGAHRVESEVGRGTTFTILFPAIARPQWPAQLTVGTNTSGFSAPNVRPDSRTVLIVDDEPGVRTVATRMLERLGFKVLLATDGRAGVDTFHAHADTISCVLLDLTMPHLNGEQALREIRQIRPDTRVVLMSGYDELEMTALFAGQGIAGFLHKPFTPAELRSKLQQVLETI
jgi:PAS domain S-box-containing protein